MLVFAPMAIGMFGVFYGGKAALYAALPVSGQQAQLQHWLSGQPVEVLPSLFLGALTIALAAAVLYAAAVRLEQDNAIYGG
jgi:hypothetical protein